MKMNKINDLVLFGGLLGTDKEICLNSKSLGEALLNVLDWAAQRIVLVNFLLVFSDSFSLDLLFILILCRLMESMAKKSVEMS